MATKRVIASRVEKKSGATRSLKMPKPSGSKATVGFKKARHSGDQFNLDLGKPSDKLTYFDRSKPIFLQIHKDNVYSYFIKGLILPVFYDPDRVRSDSQSYLDRHLVVSNGYTVQPSEDTLLIELAFPNGQWLAEDENRDTAFLAEPIPISRIRKMYVFSNTEKSEILAIAKTTDAGLIPESILCSGFPAELTVSSLTDAPSARPQIVAELDDQSSKIDKFNRVLGAFASVRNVPFLFAKQTGRYSNFTTNFFEFVNLVLPNTFNLVGHTSRYVKFYQHLLGTDDSDKTLRWIFDRSSKEKNITEVDIAEFVKTFLSKHPDKSFREETKTILEELKSGITRKDVPVKIQSIDNPEKIFPYLFAFLYIYGNRNSEDRTNARINLIEESRFQQAELLFALLGYFYGYKLLRNYESASIFKGNVFWQTILPQGVPLKFSFDTLFDYYLVEAVYLECFHFGEEKTFLSLDYLNPEIENTNYALPKVREIGSPKVFNVCNKQFFVYEDETRLECIHLVSQLHPEISIISEVGLYCFENALPIRYDFNCIYDLSRDREQIHRIAVFQRSDLLTYISKGKQPLDELLLKVRIQLAKQK